MMFSRFCNLCHKTTNVQFVKLQRCYRKGSSNNKKKRNVSCTNLPEKAKKGTAIIICKKKELNFYEGQIYSKFEPIPLAAKGWHHYKSKGDYFFIHPLVNVEQEAYVESDEIESFNNFGLDQQLINVLERYSITRPLKIQIDGIPKIMNGSNTVITAETGCGKTLSYLIPMINKILTWKTLKNRPYNSPLGLIVTPTRELAFQIGLEAEKICQYLGIRTKTFTGGKTKKILLDPPLGHVDIIVASFGVISKLTTNDIYKLDMVRYIVLDEADSLFDETFEDKLQVFLRRIPIGFVQNLNNTEFPNAAQLTVTSATMPSRMSEVLENIVNIDSLIQVKSDKLHHILVPQKFMRIGPSDKPIELLKYIKPKVANKEPVIIFSNNSATCNWVSMFLNNSYIKTVHLSGTMPMYMRNGMYANFKSGRCNVLCTTNAGSRGLDTVAVRHVLNYEFPLSTTDYIHRCGRTGRVGSVKDCRVTNFVSTLAEIGLVRKIERATRKMKPIPICDIYGTQEDNEEPLKLQNVDDKEQANVNKEFSIPY
ncbi:probable ATP-dependent RNA helicase DDX28 [Odontomachus brunneus]|uniref:probable ATP-dependent RNA helicase DDX28 n=1 Tax=Odontomachus brunneus TaxID=486640 RepID=UPI0013F225DC|nr:probable ATP-dependent RNA helicase DDX28 [Odontomachus brunneus]